MLKLTKISLSVIYGKINSGKPFEFFSDEKQK
jgi:hypothetical protein